MNRKKLLMVVAATTILVLGGGAAVATQQLEEEEEAPIDKGATPAENGQQDETASETPAKLVKVDRAAAEAAALDAVPGEVRETELENEGGFVVYEVEIVDGAPRPARSPRRPAGGLREVVVDAGNGEVLGQEIEEDEGPDEDAE